MIVHDSSKTKIIATIGPATSSKEKIKDLIRSGIDVCRINFSHGTQSDHKKVIQNIRDANAELATNVCILADLQGPKIRLGTITEAGVIIKEGDHVVFSTDKDPAKGKIPVKYPPFARDVKKDDSILIDDGKVRLRAVSTDLESEVTAVVLNGGPLFSNKGINLPDTKVSIPGLTEKDRKDIEFILAHDLDWIALSFVRSANDIMELKKVLEERGKDILIIAKIEKPEALYEINRIIEISDGVMIARGDLGVEVSYDRVPLIQKQIVQKCIIKAKPVIVATQMLESMMVNVQPTRAEANDVANAVFDSADTVMLSGETSVGRYPVESIRAMQKIIDSSEGTDFVHTHQHLPQPGTKNFISDSLCFNACKLADQSGAKAIVSFTEKPEIAFQISSYRPHAPIYIFTPNKKTLQQLAIVWGVRPFLIEAEQAADDQHSINFLKNKGFLKNGDIIVFLNNLPSDKNHEINSIKLINT